MFVFAFCPSLTAINVVAENPVYSSVNGVVFDKVQATLVACPGALAGTYLIPDGATSIGDSAFADCGRLTGITIPNSVTNLEDNAFIGCFNLPGIAIPDGVVNIGYGAFSECFALTNITIPGSVAGVGEAAFENCSSLTAILVDPQNAFYASINGVLFDKAQTKLLALPGGFSGSYQIPNSVTSIGSASLGGCAELSSITIPASVTSIGDFAFYECLALTCIDCAGNAPSLGSYTFYSDNNPTVHYLPGTTGWANFSIITGFPIAPWFLPTPLILNGSPAFGVQTRTFGFTISWATNISVVVEVCTNLAHPVWQPTRTNTLAGGTAYFSDAASTNYASRFYRLSVP